MKILFVINGFPTNGNSIHTYNLAKTLSNDHEITLVCFDADFPYRKDKEHYANIHIVPFEKKNFLNKSINSLLSGTPFFVQTNKSADMIKIIKSICMQEKFDVVMFEPLAMGQYLFYTQDIPKILFPVDATSRIKKQKHHEANSVVNKIIHYIDYLMTIKYEKFLYEKADAIMFSSNYDSEYTMKNVDVNQKKVITVPEGVDLSYFHNSSDLLTQKPSIAFLGGMAHYPNKHGMLWFYNNVWKKLKVKQPDLLFYIVGSNPGEEIRNLSVLDKDIIVTGYVDDVRPYIRQASVFISPLQVGTGMKNKVLQAMAMGKAIVASPLDIQGIQAEDGKHVILARNPDEFVKHINSLLLNKQKRDELGFNARKLVEKNHTLKRKGDQFMDIATRIIGNRSLGKKYE
jgi:glycosyltransferase involved in cell wall biosynthesis